MKLCFNLVLFISLQCFSATQLIVVGDTGKDNDGQKLVADAMTKHCSVEVCNYGVLVGDNVYEEGVTSPTDPVMDRMFKKYYDHLPFPFYIALGNHDYGKYSNDWIRGSYQLDYAKKNPQFILPSYFYYVEQNDFVMVVLDTSRLMWNKDVQAQEALINEAYSKANGKWFIVVGHHPYLSNGKHGNAGNYEGLPYPPMVSGRDVKKFIEKNVCGRAQIYLSGHDHSLQLIDGRSKNCQTIFAISGTGASVTDLSARNVTLFEASKLGFMTVSIDAANLELKFIDSENQALAELLLKR